MFEKIHHVYMMDDYLIVLIFIACGIKQNPHTLILKSNFVQ